MKLKIAQALFGRCTHIWLATSIRQNMDIEPCACADLTPDHVQPWDDDFLKIWNSPQYKGTRRYLKDKNDSDKKIAFSRCCACPVMGLTAYPIIAWRQFRESIKIISPIKSLKKLFNLSRGILSSILGSDHLKHFPVYANICPANFCQLKCPFCGIGSGENVVDKGLMTLENFKKVMSVLGPNLMHLNLYRYGEPLLNKDIYKMVKIAKEYNVYTQISTNFQQFGEAEAKELIESKLDSLVICADGLDQDTYQKYRVNGSYDNFRHNIDLVLNAMKNANSKKPEVCWQFLVFKHNEKQIPEAHKMAKHLGIKFKLQPAYIKLEDEYVDWIPESKEHTLYNIDDSIRCEFLCAIDEIEVKTNENVTIELTAKNIGKSTWKPSENYRVGARIYDSDKNFITDFARASLNDDVLPNEKDTLIIQIKAPNERGLYHIKIDMLVENDFWFETKGSKPHWIKLRTI